MIAQWFKKLIRPPKEKIRIPDAVQEMPHPPTATPTLKEQLESLLVQVDVDAVVKSPLSQIAIVTLYTSSSHELIKETLTASRNRSLVGVRLTSFFKESHLPASLTLKRLAELFEREPASNYARYDIETLIEEFRTLGA